MRSTVFAPATAAGRAAVAVVRLSGPASGDILAGLCGRLPPARRASVRPLRDAAGEALDQAMVLWLPGPHSFTGEDCAELHTHGGPAVVEAVCRALTDAGAQLAEPGEFTRRAFEAGRLDLAQAEAVADLVDAETEAQRRQAAQQLSGALSRRYETWRERLLDALARVEAGIDFPDEDVPDGVVATAAPLLAEVVTELEAELGDARGERVRQGLRVALVGAPNVGKSSLLNALCGRDAAIVTPIPGTTRDVVEAPLVIAGQAVTLADTAGLRESEDLVEREGVARARRWSDAADLRLAVADATRSDTLDAARALMRSGDILAVNKVDLCAAAPSRFKGAVATVATSSGVGPLWDALAQRVGELTVGRDFPAITRARHRDLLLACRGHLRRALTSLSAGAELAGEDVRLAIRDLERVTGRGDPEAVLDRVFSTFCIGK